MKEKYSPAAVSAQEITSTPLSNCRPCRAIAGTSESSRFNNVIVAIKVTIVVLFIVAGAFAGLDEIITSRAGRRGIGFGAPLHSADDTDVFGEVMPEDLLKFGLIPEFIGRLPVITTVSPLDQQALVRILTEPRNALIKQYQRMFEIDGVELEFTPDAIEAVADQALLRGTGARGLRAILEEVLQQVMFDVPSRDDIARVVVNRGVVLENVNPTIVPREPSTAKRTPREKSA